MDCSPCCQCLALVALSAAVPAPGSCPDYCEDIRCSFFASRFVSPPPDVGTPYHTDGVEPCVEMRNRRHWARPRRCHDRYERRSRRSRQGEDTLSEGVTLSVRDSGIKDDASSPCVGRRYEMLQFVAVFMCLDSWSGEIDLAKRRRLISGSTYDCECDKSGTQRLRG